jgi:hypothetical protein
LKEKNAMASVRKDEGLECVIHGWYDPSDDRPLGNVCVVRGCALPATFQLCPLQALPGMVVEVGNPGEKFVINSWVVEKNGKRHILTINDCMLGTYFGSSKKFEEQLASQGYSILHIVSSEEELFKFNLKLAHPDLCATPWICQEILASEEGKG